jgi:hypothetical protein
VGNDRRRVTSWNDGPPDRPSPIPSHSKTRHLAQHVVADREERQHRTAGDQRRAGHDRDPEAVQEHQRVQLRVADQAGQRRDRGDEQQRRRPGDRVVDPAGQPPRAARPPSPARSR